MGVLDLVQIRPKENMEKSKKYFNHYFKEIQATKDKFKDNHYFKEIQATRDKFKDYVAVVAGNEAETQKLIELKDFSADKDDVFERKTGNEVTSNNAVAENEEPVDDKAKLIRDIKELSRTLEDITEKIVNVKTDTTKLAEENQVIDEYILSLMEQSKTFEPTD